jgi:hypothetical protein
MDIKIDLSQTLTPPSGYKNAKLLMPSPAKPVKGIGYSRLRWRKDGLLANYGTAASKFMEVERGLQIWFFDLLPTKHKAILDKDYYVTPEAWRVFIDNLEFWKSEWNRVKIIAAHDKREKSKAKAKHAARKRVKIERKIAKSADVVGYEKSALKGKLNRLKSMLLNNDSRMLAVELVKDAEPWLLECILAGSSVKKTRDGTLEIDSGPFFQSKKSSGWGTGSAPDPSIELIFWFAVAKAHELGCCPKSIVFEDITALNLHTHSEEEYILAINEVLPGFKSLQSLLLRLEFSRSIFKTADLPAMESLCELTIFGNHKDSSIKIESLEKHRSLKKIRIDYFSELDCEENQYDIIAKLEFDNSCSTQLKKISITGLRILLMAESQNDTTATNASRPMGDFLDLSSLENLPSEHAAIIAKAGVNVCLKSSCLDAKAIEILTEFNGELHLIGNCRIDQLMPMMNLKCALFLDLEDELDEESAKLLAEFQAKMIQISCEGITEMCMNHIIKYPGALYLGGWRYYSDFEIDLKLAKTLLLRKAPLKLEEGWRIGEDAMAVLVTNINLDLMSYRRTFEKSEKAGKSTAILEKLYDQNIHKEHLLRSTFRNTSGIVKVTNEFRSSQRNNQGISYLEAAASKLLQNGWNEVTAIL